MEMLPWIPLIVFFGVVLLMVLVLKAKGKGQYDSYIEELDKKEWSLAPYMDIGFQWNTYSLMEKITKPFAKMWNKYQQGVYRNILLLYGKEPGSKLYYHVYQANKTTLSFFILLLTAIFSLLGAFANKDVFLGYKVAAIGTLFALVIPFLTDYGLQGKLEQREQDLLMEFPSFGSKLILLVEAGMSVPKGIRKIVADSKENTVLVRELKQMLINIESGEAETAAYEEFARRSRVKEINRFMSVLVQSMEKGGHNLTLTLKVQIQECWQSRRNAAVLMGEQASTKLVLPLMLMMVAIIVIVGGPALMMFSQM